MQAGRISVRYAKALYDYSSSEKTQDEVYKDSYVLLDLIENNKEFVYLLNNPVIAAKEKERVISMVLKDAVNKTLFNLIRLLIVKNREAYIQNSLLIFQKIYRENQGVFRVILECATEPTKEFEGKIIDFVNTRFKKKTELIVKIKPELIGGFILQVENLLVDQSIIGQLNIFKKSLIPEQKVI